MSVRYQEIKYYNVICGGCQKTITTSSPTKCVKCGVHICGKCGELKLCPACRSSLSDYDLKSLRRKRKSITLNTLLLVLGGVTLFVTDFLGITPDITSVIIGFMLMLFAIPYWALSITIFFPKKVQKVLSFGTPSKRRGDKIDMSKNPVTSLFRCPKCGAETDAIFGKRSDDGKWSVICRCGERLTEDQYVHQCSKCKKYYPKGIYRCKKCKMGP